MKVYMNCSASGQPYKSATGDAISTETGFKEINIIKPSGQVFL
jgi:hypothetical protein